jgi:hypothetical protein
MSIKLIDLTEKKSRVYSEHNQDSILEEIFNNIGLTENKYFVEFGSNGCKHGGGNTAYLREVFGMDGLLMDGCDNPYGKKRTPDFKREIEFIKAENINELFKKYNVPSHFDFLSIDVDGEDYWIMKMLDIEKYKPNVICIETNYHIHPDYKLVQKHNPNHIWRKYHHFGCSSSAMLDLLNKKNYTMVGYAGCDCIFVCNDVIKKNNLKFKGENNLLELGVLKGPIWKDSKIKFQEDPFWMSV